MRRFMRTFLHLNQARSLASLHTTPVFDPHYPYLWPPPRKQLLPRIQCFAPPRIPWSYLNIHLHLWIVQSSVLRIMNIQVGQIYCVFFWDLLFRSALGSVGVHSSSWNSRAIALAVLRMTVACSIFQSLFSEHVPADLLIEESYWSTNNLTLR